MLEIDVSLIPFGFRDAKRSIGKIVIINDGTGTGVAGNYEYSFRKEDKTVISGKIKGVRRDRDVFYFLRDLLNEVLKED